MTVKELNAVLTKIQENEDAGGRVERARRQMWAEFSAAMKQGRIERAWSLNYFSDRLGIRKSFLSYLENGHREWSMELAQKAVEVMSR
jgi:hypothetical protein